MESPGKFKRPPASAETRPRPGQDRPQVTSSASMSRGRSPRCASLPTPGPFTGGILSLRLRIHHDASLVIFRRAGLTRSTTPARSREPTLAAAGVYLTAAAAQPARCGTGSRVGTLVGGWGSSPRCVGIYSMTGISGMSTSMVSRREAALHDRQLMAGCCPPPRSPVRPLSNALRAFNAQWPLAPCESGLNGRHEWIEARRGRR
jgi:hypothetical protein